MASLTLTDVTYFRNGDSTEGSYSKLVGASYSGTDLHVVRYSFTTSSIGARSITIKKTGLGSHTNSINLRFYITTDANSYKQAGPTTSNYYSLTKTYSGGEYTFTGTANIILLPNTTYYIWFFAAENYGYYYWNYPNQYEASWTEGAGLIKIYTSSGWKNAIPYIYTGSTNGWKMALPYVYKNSTDGWKICSG